MRWWLNDAGGRLLVLEWSGVGGRSTGGCPDGGVV
jgi:hypothetical protein